MSILTLREKILIFLKNHKSAPEEVLDLFLGPYFWMWEERYGSKEYWEVRRSLLKEIEFLRKHGYLRDIATNRKVYLRPSVKGEKKINWEVSIKRREGKWDGKWYIVAFDIPEKYKQARENLRKKLYDLGFGLLQNSVFISPYNYFRELKILAEKNQIKPYLKFIVAEEIDDSLELIQASWNFEELNIKYMEFINKCERLEFKNLNFFKRMIIFKSLEKELANIFKEDPQLPKEVCPKNYLGEKAREYLRRLRKIMFKNI